MNFQPNSAAARDIAYHIHPQTNLKQLRDEGPLVVTRGKGVRVWDEDGKEYIETMAGLWCAALGFDNERLVKAAERQMRKLPFYHGFTARVHDTIIDLAEKVISIAPEGMTKIFFGNSGSDANDTAIKFVWYYNNAVGRPKKKKIIARDKAYHGVTVASGSLTGLPPMHKAFDLPLPGFLHTDCAHYYRFGNEGESPEDYATRLADNLDKLIVAEGPDTVAAFFAEPFMGAGGAMMPPPTYFEKVQKVLKKHDVLFVADEVITGFMRTGNTWGVQTFDIRPDIVTCAKALSSAYLPISGVMVSEPIYEAMVKQSGEIGHFGHGFTYSGHPVSAAVALEALKIYEEIDLLGHVRRVGPYMQQQLKERLGDHPLVGDVRGVGMVAGVELMKDKEKTEPFDPALKVGPNVQKTGQRHGLILRAVVDTLCISPPLVMVESEVDEMIDRLIATLDEVHAMCRRSGLVAA